MLSKAPVINHAESGGNASATPSRSNQSEGAVSHPKTVSDTAAFDPNVLPRKRSLPYIIQSLPRALTWRCRLVWLRFKSKLFRRNVYFGRNCVIQRGFHLRVDDQAQFSVGDDCILDRDLTIECYNGSHLTIGSRTVFGHHCTIAAREAVSIGEDCLIAELVAIRDHDHCFDRWDIATRRQGLKSSPVVIGRNVWLGSKVTVVRGVTIGDNAVIGANAVVTKDIPANAIAVGIPARVIRMREADAPDTDFRDIVAPLDRH